MVKISCLRNDPYPRRRLRAGVVALALAFALAGCAEIQFLSQASKETRGVPPSLPDEAVADAVPNGTHYKVGQPYQINGIWYYPKVDYSYVEEGIASWYGPGFHGKETANGAIFDMNKVSAAHRTLPMPSMVRVTNLENGRSLKVKVNDRGPFARNRIIDLSRRGAQLLGFEQKGTALVRVEIVEDESRQLAALMLDGSPAALAALGPAPDAAPATRVSATALEPPPGETSAAPQQAAASQAPAPRETRVDAIAEPDETVTLVPVAGQPQIFVQAGAFAQYINAQRSQAMLSALGNVEVEQILRSSVPLFRVRIGPYMDVDAADRTLSAVIDAGYTDAQIVVAQQ